jgi:hypothetical protein
MRQKKAILFGAALAALPVVAGHAATITYTYNPVITFGTSPTSVTSGAGTIAGTSVTGTGAAEVVTVPAGDYVSVGMQVTVSNNGGSGLAAFDIGMNNSNPAAASVYNANQAVGAVLTSPKISGSIYNLQTFKGEYDGNGGVLGTAVGAIAGVVKATGATNAQSLNGAGTATNAFTGLVIAAKAGGTSVFTPIQVNSGTSIFLQNSLGASSAATSSYNTRAFSAASDTMGLMPTLTIVTTGLSTSTTSSSTSTAAHPIVALSNTTPTQYGSQVGTLTLLGHNSSYNVSSTTISPAASQGYVVTSVFSPLTDTEVYALKLNASGAVLSPTSTEVALIVADINASGTGSNVSAGAVVGSPYASLFPGYDILLTSTAGFTAGSNGAADLGFDFSQDSDAATPGLTVTAVAAVPEPATTAGLVIGAAGLLLGRRKSRTLA